MLQDVRHALRMMWKSPGFTIAAVLTLAIGLGANAAIFSVINAVLLKPLPYGEPERALVIARANPPGATGTTAILPWGGFEFKQFEKISGTFTAIGAFRSDFFNISNPERSERIDGALVTAGFFQAVGRQPALGRSFTADEDRPGHEHVVVIGYDLWQRVFAGDPGIVGRTITLNGASYNVVGVMPKGFSFPNGAEMPPNFQIPARTEIWTPLALPDNPRGPAYLLLIARMRPGLTVAQARASMALAATQLEKAFPDGKGWFNCVIVPLPDQIAGSTRPALWILWGAVGILLLIACANLTSLLLVRCAGRRREFSVRLALGAQRSTLLRQLTAEGAILAIFGGALGLAFAYGLVRAIQILESQNLPRIAGAGLDLRVFAFSLALSLAVGFLLGWTASRDAGRTSINSSLRESALSAGMGKRVSRLHSIVVVGEIALTIILLAAAGLLARTFSALAHVDTGFRPHQALTFELTLPAAKYTNYDSQVAFYREALERLNRAPGISSAALVAPLPLSGNDESTVFHVDNTPIPPGGLHDMTEYSIVSASFFDALQIPITHGRAIADSDTAESMPVVVINESFARQLFPGMNPIGHKVKLGSDRYPTMTVIGVSADTKVLNLRDRPPIGIYVPYTQHPYPTLESSQFVIRSVGAPESAVSSVRDAIRSVDSDQPVAKIQTMELLVSDALSGERFLLFMIGLFAAMALVLAIVGIYGVLAYVTSQRAHEIGIRIALGAQRSDVARLVLGHGLALTLAGVALGLAGAWVTTRALNSVLFAVSSTDPLTFFGVAAILGCAAMLACYIPARRATRVDPMVALRYE
jgi:putative ABC transport system permease protein